MASQQASDLATEIDNAYGWPLNLQMGFVSWINSAEARLSAPAIPSHTPSAANDTGTAGQITYDASFLYICVATNTWLKVAIATW